MWLIRARWVTGVAENGGASEAAPPSARERIVMEQFPTKIG